MKWGATLFVLFAFAAGGAFGYLVGDGSGRTELRMEGADVAPAPRAASERRDAPAPSAPPSADTADGSRDASDFPGREVPTGDGTITGTVRDESGQPLARVLVRAWCRTKSRPSTYRRGDGPPDDPDLDAAVRDFVSNWRFQRACRREAETDASGHYEIGGIGDGGWYLNAWLEGYELRHGTSGEIHAGDVVDFTAKALATLPVTVRMPDGRTAASATIEVGQGGRRTSQGWSAERPFVRVEPGTWQVRANGGDESEYRSEEVTVTVEAGVAPESVTLDLADRPGVRGRVIFASAGENASGTVAAVPAGDGGEPDPQILQRSPHRTWFRAGSTFVLRDLTAGRWFVAATTNDGSILASATVEIAEGMVERDLTVPEPEPREYVIVSVEGPDGTLVADATFYASLNLPRDGARSQRYHRLPDGTWRVFNPRPKEGVDTSAGTWTIHVYTQQYGSKVLEYVPRAGARLSCRFEEPAYAEFEVVGADRIGNEGTLQVYLRSMPDENGRTDTAGGFRPIEGGKTSIGPVVPGEYDAVLSLRDRRGSMTSLATTRIRLVAGHGKQTLTVPPLYSLTVLLPDSSGRARGTISLRDASAGERFYQSAEAEDGKIHFENVPAGDYRVWVSGAASGQMDVTVPASAVVEFRPIVVNAYLVHVTAADGALAQAGFREGDLLVGIDGKEFENAQQIGALFTLARSQKKTRFTVQRGNRIVEIEVEEPAKVLGGNTGGRLEGTHR